MLSGETDCARPCALEQEAALSSAHRLPTVTVLYGHILGKMTHQLVTLLSCKSAVHSPPSLFLLYTYL